MKYISSEHKKIYNILKKEKENYNYMELFSLIKTSRINYDSNVTHKKSLGYYLINEASESLLVKLKDEGLLDLVKGDLICAKNLTNENIQRLEIFKKHNICPIMDFSYIEKLFSKDPILQEKMIALFKNKILTPSYLEVHQYNAYVSHYYSPIDSLEKIKIMEQCGFIFNQDSLFFLSYYTPDSECDKIINYFKDKIELDKSFEKPCLTIKGSFDDESDINITLNIAGYYLLKKDKHPFFKALMRNSYIPFLSKEIHTENIANFKGLNSFIEQNPNFVFNHEQKITSFSIALAQRNNEIITTSNSLCIYLAEVFQRTDTSNLLNIESLFNLLIVDTSCLKEILYPIKDNPSLFSLLNQSLELQARSSIQDILNTIFYQNKNLFQDIRLFSNDLRLIKQNKFLQDFFIYQESALFTQPIFPSYLLHINEHKTINFSEVIKENGNLSLKHHLNFLFHTSNTKFSYNDESYIIKKGQILDDITQAIANNFKNQSVNYLDDLTNFQLEHSPEKWNDPKNIIKLVELKSQLLNKDNGNTIKHKKRL